MSRGCVGCWVTPGRSLCRLCSGLSRRRADDRYRGGRRALENTVMKLRVLEQTGILRKQGLGLNLKSGQIPGLQGANPGVGRATSPLRASGRVGLSGPSRRTLLPRDLTTSLSPPCPAPRHADSGSKPRGKGQQPFASCSAQQVLPLRLGVHRGSPVQHAPPPGAHTHVSFQRSLRHRHWFFALQTTGRRRRVLRGQSSPAGSSSFPHSVAQGRARPPTAVLAKHRRTLRAAATSLSPAATTTGEQVPHEASPHRPCPLLQLRLLLCLFRL